MKKKKFLESSSKKETNKIQKGYKVFVGKLKRYRTLFGSKLFLIRKPIRFGPKFCLIN